MAVSRPWQTQIEVNRNSVRPLYLQVKEALEEWILDCLHDGSLNAGDRLPSENELSEQLGVSTITVKRSLDELRRQGLIQRIQGRGSFVVGQKKFEFPLEQHFSLTTVTRRLYGMEPVRQTLELTETAASLSVAAHLNLMPGERVVRLVRLRLMDKIPVSVETSYLPLRLFPDLASVYTEETSLYDLLKARYDREVVRAEDTIEPVLINAFEAQTLEVPLGTLGILIERMGFGADGARYELTKMVYRGDLCSFSNQIMKEKE
jgi:GntR family transcriptional regulator